MLLFLGLESIAVPRCLTKKANIMALLHKHKKRERAKNDILPLIKSLYKYKK